MADHTVFERDFRLVHDRFPKLNYVIGQKLLRVYGEIDICDGQGVYWGTFEIKILISRTYPYCVPLLYEKSNIIPRNIDHHIDDDGLCCVDITHKLLFRSKRGLSIYAFLSEWVYPYLANQLHHIKENKYVGEEYAHYFPGVQQFYFEDLQLDTLAAIKMLQSIITKINDGRNDPCPCGSGKKLKKCHLSSYEFLKSLGANPLKSDLKNFQELQSDNDDKDHISDIPPLPV